MPLLSIILNSEGKTVSCDSCSVEENYAKHFTERALRDMLDTGKPKKITVMNERTYNMYLKLAEYLGIELVFADYCGELEEAEDQLYYSMEEGLPDEFDEMEQSDEEKEHMTVLINSVDDFSQLGDIDLAALYFAATAMSLEISPNKLSLLKKEVERRNSQM